MQTTIIVGGISRRIGRVDFPSRVGQAVVVPHWSVYTRAISVPVQSLIEIGRFGGENFSPNCAKTDRIPK